MTKKLKDRDSVSPGSYSPGPIKVKKPGIQTKPPQNLSPGPMPSKDTFPEAGKKSL